MKARAYQAKAVAQLLKLLPKHKRVCAVAPTGSGKTVIAAMLMRKLKGMYGSKVCSVCGVTISFNQPHYVKRVTCGSDRCGRIAGSRYEIVLLGQRLTGPELARICNRQAAENIED